MNNNKIFDNIIKKNQDYIADFRNSPLMRLIADTKMDDSCSRAKLLDCIQVFSNYFQKTVMLRAVLNDDNRFIKIAQEHLAEEFGHNTSLT